MQNEALWDLLKDQLEEKLAPLGVDCRDKRTHKTMSCYVKGLLSSAERKNSWQLSEEQGASTPYRFQHMLYHAAINEEKLQVELAKSSVETLGSNGILTFDDTGFLKKGDQSAGVQRQYTGTAGRIENCQIGTFMGYKTDKGHTLLDTRLYIPESWTNDRDRCQKAKIPDAVVFEKKALHAVHMYEDFKQQGHSCSWVTADEAYGKDPDFIKALEDAKQGYVVAISQDHHVRCGDLKQKLAASRWAEKEDQKHWKRLSAGAGSKGERLYDWLLIKRSEMITPVGYERFLLVRKSITTGELAYYSVFSPIGADSETFVKVAGSRWSIEECFEMAKGETGLDHYEVRTYHGWKRHMILSMWALHILVFLKNKMNEKKSHCIPNHQIKEQIITSTQDEQKKEDQTSVVQNTMSEYKKKQKILSSSQFKKLPDL
jgi:SRSO17 transposase